MRNIRCEVLIWLTLTAVQAPLHAQSPGSSSTSPSPSSVSDERSAELMQKMEAISSALAVTHQQLEQSQREMEQLREELADLKKQLAAAQPGTTGTPNPDSTADTAKATAATIEGLQEQQQTIEAQVKVHDQTKLESASKYPLHVTGLVLFNAFVNGGTSITSTYRKPPWPIKITLPATVAPAPPSVRPFSGCKDMVLESGVREPPQTLTWISSEAWPIAAMQLRPERFACAPRASTSIGPTIRFRRDL